jgi:tetratricopeptide (TPR) repeat protein
MAAAPPPLSPQQRDRLQRAYALHQKGQLEHAAALYREVLAIEPSQLDALHLLGMALYGLGRPENALASFERALRHAPHSVEAHFYSGVLLTDLKRYPDALDHFERTIALAPNHAEAHVNRGNVLRELQRFDEAVASYTNAIRIRPDFALAYSNRGSALREQGDLGAALESYDRAVALKSDYATAYCNRGVVLSDLRLLDRALASYDAAIAIARDYADAHYFKGLLQLLRADYRQGWAEHEWRWKSGYGSFSQQRRDFPQPLWLGQAPVAGKTVLLYAEQGLGDILQFCRYASLVAQRGARVILEVPQSLVGLLAGLEGVARIVPYGAPLPAFDYQCPLMSLPLAFNTAVDTIPAPRGYLKSDSAKVARWRQKLGEKRAPRIGLSWTGNPLNPHNRERRIPLEVLIRGLPAGFQYVSLQKELTDADRRTLQVNPHILEFSAELQDFTDTAALCECVDLVISICTSVAHLSGALGRPTWVLLAFAADWRWLLDRADSPWYPTAKLYRQSRAGDWPEVLEKVAADLGGHIFPAPQAPVLTAQRPML